jgi:hypothetical protein
MKQLEKDELFQNLNGFLKTKGIELTEGSYSQRIQKSCALLSEAINTGRDGLHRAKAGLDKGLDQIRQVIHEKTAPKPRASSPPPEGPPQAGANSSPNQTSAEASGSEKVV